MNLQMKQRNRNIKQKFQAGKKVKDLAIATSLSESRIRQIITEKDLHDFYRELESKYKQQISESDYKWLKEEILILAQQNRNKELVIRRRILVQYLHDKLGYPFYRIGQLLERHHTSIINLYYGK